MVRHVLLLQAGVIGGGTPVLLGPASCRFLIGRCHSLRPGGWRCLLGCQALGRLEGLGRLMAIPSWAGGV